MNTSALIQKVAHECAQAPYQRDTHADGEEDRDALTYARQNFLGNHANKQLNSLQHIITILKDNGQAAVVLPNNVLFALKTRACDLISQLRAGFFMPTKCTLAYSA